MKCGKDGKKYKSPEQSKGVGYCPCGKKPYKSAKYLGMDIWEICSCGACVLIDAALKEQFKQARTEIENGECITLKTDEDVRKYIETLGSR